MKNNFPLKGADSFTKAAEESRSLGAEFLSETISNKGLEEALNIGERHLSAQLKQELSNGEKQFCKELFTAMFDVTKEKTDPAKLVYPYDFKKAEERLEASLYHDSRKINAACAAALDEAIHDSCYKVNHYNLDIAAMKAICDYGFERVNMVLCENIQMRDYDGRFSEANKQWAAGYDVSSKAFDRAIMNAHPVLIDSLVNHARKLYAELGADRYALPGRPESGELVQGYEIVRVIAFDNDRGFAIGLNPNAASEFACWQFTAENGVRDFYWGTYADDLITAAENYTARVLVHMNSNDIREVTNYLAPAEKSTEQNYNMIDGVMNNTVSSKPDLTDGQTHEEIRELAPHTLMPGSEVRNAEDLSDPTVTQDEMHAYGYTWDGMIPLGKERALELYDKGHAILRLYEDDAEGYADNREAIETFDGLFGIENPAWAEPEREQENLSTGAALSDSHPQNSPSQKPDCTSDEKTSVLKEIHEARETQKPPKDETRHTNKKDKGGHDR